MLAERGAWHSGILAVVRQAIDEAAQRLGLRSRYVYFQSPEELPAVFAEMVKEREQALLILSDPGIAQVVPQIVALAVKLRLVTMAESADWPTAGALMAYGPKADDIYRQAAMYVDRILKGARPNDLPIGQPTTFELITTSRPPRRSASPSRRHCSRGRIR